MAALSNVVLLDKGAVQYGDTTTSGNVVKLDKGAVQAARVVAVETPTTSGGADPSDLQFGPITSTDDDKVIIGVVKEFLRQVA